MRNRFGVVVGVLAILLGSPRFFCCSRLVGAAAPSFGSSVGGVASRGFVLVGCLRLARVLFALVGLLCWILLLFPLLRLLCFLVSSVRGSFLRLLVWVLPWFPPRLSCLLVVALSRPLGGTLSGPLSGLLSPVGLVSFAFVRQLGVLALPVLLPLLLRFVPPLPPGVRCLWWVLLAGRVLCVADTSAVSGLVFGLGSPSALPSGGAGSFQSGLCSGSFVKGPPFLHTSLPPVVCRIAVGAVVAVDSPIPRKGVVRGDVLGFMSLSSLGMCRSLIGSPTEGLQALTNPSLPYGPQR